MSFYLTKRSLYILYLSEIPSYPKRNFKKFVANEKCELILNAHA